MGETAVLSPHRETADTAVAVAVVHAFLRVLAAKLTVVEQRATPVGCARTFDELWRHLAAHIPNLAAAMGDRHNDEAVRRIAPSRRQRFAAVLSRLGMRVAADAAKPTQDSSGVTIMKGLAGMGDGALRDLAKAIVGHHRASVDKAFALLSDIKTADGRGRPVVFVTVGFPTTWAPLAEALTRAGVATHALCLYDYRESLETGVLNTVEIPVGRATVLDFIGHLIVLAAGAPAAFLVNGDAYYGANWDAARTTLTYLLSGAMLAAARDAGADRGLLVALKYDAVQPFFVPDPPVDHDPADMLVSDFYRFTMRQADRVIYNANSPGMGAFNETAVPLDAPRLHFYRYASRPDREVAKPDWGRGEDIHLVILSSFLSDSEDHTRNHQADVVRSVLRQRIHVHYFCNTASPALDAFRRTLPDGTVDYFHPHGIIRDQRALVEEVQQYHLGLVLSDDSAFLRSIASLTDPFYREAESVLRATTMNSGAFVFAAAGLPFIYPRYMVGIQDVFGGDVAMPMTPSEIDALRSFLEDCDMPRRMAAAREARPHMWMDANIGRLAEFVEAEPGAPR